MMPQASHGPKDEFTIDTDEESGVAVITMVARITGQRLVCALDALAGHEGYRAVQPRLWDFRDADLSQLTRAELRLVARHVRSLELSPPESRAGVLVSRDVDFGVIRMFELTEAESLSGVVRAFRDLSRAQAWLLGADAED